jgi:pSer/pThr/pTyr-binding forkhead associated (FHA) protein
MNDSEDKTIRTDVFINQSDEKKKVGFSSTLEISRKTFIGKIPSKQHAFLEMLGGEPGNLELGENEVVIGRVPDCDIQLMVENVSRKHARIFYVNEEYKIEDMGSTNGIYVNGIKVEKCSLRNQDLIEIGGVKILFNEGKIR